MSRERTPSLHPHLAPLAFLLGTWRGEGKGEFHTVEPFSFEEKIRFSHRGGPWLVYEQRARSTADGELLHAEMGFWRPLGEGRVDAYVALNAGSDFSEGTVLGTTVTLRSTTTRMGEGIEEVTRLERRYEVADDTLTYEISLGTEGQAFGWHVGGRLARA